MEFNGEDLSSVAYNVFDERIDDRGEIGSRLYLSSPNDETPAVFVEKDGERFDIVFTWNGEEKYRDDLGRIFYDDARRYLS